MEDMQLALSSEKDDVKALKEFLLDIGCLDALSEWASSFNLFDILKISRVEIRHSNMLAWLLNPNENHGLGDSILRGFVRHVVSSFSDDTDVFETLLMDCHDFSVQREWHNIDILAVSYSERFVLCIENKIDSREHDDQLNRYRKQIDDAFPEYRKMYIYLSPDRGESSDPDNWCSMGYEDVYSIIVNARKRTELTPEAAFLVENYLDIIRRDIVGDKDLARICAEIYAKHQKALDLIFENKPDRASALAGIIHKWAEKKAEENELIYVSDKSGKTCTRFKTRAMSDLMPDSPDTLSSWGTSNYYFYEIRNNDGKEFYIQFVLNSKDIPSSLRTVCDRINQHFPSRQQKVNWQWRTPFATKRVKVDDDLSEEKVFEQLDKKWEDIKAFETRLLSRLDSERS